MFLHVDLTSSRMSNVLQEGEYENAIDEASARSTGWMTRRHATMALVNAGRLH